MKTAYKILIQNFEYIFCSCLVSFSKIPKILVGKFAPKDPKCILCHLLIIPVYAAENVQRISATTYFL